MPAAEEYVTGAEAARRIGITAQAVGVWGARSGAPVRTRQGARQYRWPQFPRWREEQLLAERKTGRVDRDEADTRKAAAEAELAELKLARERGLVVPADHVAAAAEAEIARFKGQVLALPTEEATLVAARLRCTEREAGLVLRDVAAALLARCAAADDE